MAIVLGSIGEEMDLLIRQGGTFGPHVFTMKNPDNTPIDLTGAILRGSIKKEPASEVSYPITYQIMNAVGGVYKMSIPAAITATIPAGPAVTSSESKYIWDAEMEDAAGNVLPLYYGKVQVFREVTSD